MSGDVKRAVGRLGWFGLAMGLLAGGATAWADDVEAERRDRAEQAAGEEADEVADEVDTHVLLPSGISIKAGMGRYSVRDEYFSSEKYSGTLPQFSATWSRLRERGGYRIGVEHRHSSDIRNNNMSAGITQFSLNLDYLYRVARLSLFSRDALWFVGPSTGFFMHFSELNIAYSELEIPYSFATLIPIGVNSTLVVPVSDRLQLAGSFRASIFSLGLRMIDLVEDVDEESPLRFLILPSGTNANLRLGLRYALTNRLTLDLGYELQVLRVQPWDPLLAVSDNLSAGFTVGLPGGGS